MNGFKWKLSAVLTLQYSGIGVAHCEATATWSDIDWTFSSSWWSKCKNYFWNRTQLIENREKQKLIQGINNVVENVRQISSGQIWKEIGQSWLTVDVLLVKFV